MIFQLVISNPQKHLHIHRLRVDNLVSHAFVWTVHCANDSFANRLSSWRHYNNTYPVGYCHSGWQFPDCRRVYRHSAACRMNWFAELHFWQLTIAELDAWDYCCNCKRNRQAAHFVWPPPAICSPSKWMSDAARVAGLVYLPQPPADQEIFLARTAAHRKRFQYFCKPNRYSLQLLSHSSFILTCNQFLKVFVLTEICKQTFETLFWFLVSRLFAKFCLPNPIKVLLTFYPKLY